MHLVTAYTALRYDLPNPLVAMKTKTVDSIIIVNRIFWNVLRLICR